MAIIATDIAKKETVIESAYKIARQLVAQTVSSNDIKSLERARRLLMSSSILSLKSDDAKSFSVRTTPAGRVMKKKQALEDSFIISAKQTWHLAVLDERQYVKIVRWDCLGGSIFTQGSRLPDEDALLHAAIYEIDYDIKSVFVLRNKNLSEAIKKGGALCVPAEYGCSAKSLEFVWKHFEGRQDLFEYPFVVYEGCDDLVAVYHKTPKDVHDAVIKALKGRIAA